MRRLFILLIMALVGVTPIVVPPAAAQYGEPDFGPVATAEPFEGVARPRPQNGTQTPSEAPVLQPYEIYFGEQYARLDNRSFANEFATEFMVIEVKQGIFGLEVGEQGTFIVDPAGETSIQHVQLPPDSETPPYVVPLAEYVRNEAGNICTNMCAIPLNTAVQVKPGDIVIAQANSLCLWCLLKGSSPDQGTDPELNGAPQPDSGLLLVSVQLETPSAAPSSFSWFQAWEAQEGVAATPSASAEPMTMAVSWAFNPPTGCN
jgi:hypothetical protein